MSEPRPFGSKDGMIYSFSKTFVHDLDAMGRFYEEVVGMVPFHRHQDEMFGRKIDEIMFKSSYEGGPSFTLISFEDSSGPVAGEAVQGFITPDVEALCERAKAAGGTIAEEIREIPEFGIKVAFVLDPEGHVLEVVEMLKG